MHDTCVYKGKCLVFRAYSEVQITESLEIYFKGRRLDSSDMSSLETHCSQSMHI